jgi:hypothetical protein
MYLIDIYNLNFILFWITFCNIITVHSHNTSLFCVEGHAMGTIWAENVQNFISFYEGKQVSDEQTKFQCRMLGFTVKRIRYKF